MSCHDNDNDNDNENEEVEFKMRPLGEQKVGKWIWFEGIQH